MRLPRESDIDWQGCKTASQEILKHLQKLNITKVEKPLNISFPRQIECNDHCDPDSLGKNSMLCLMKIRRGLHRYQELLTQYAKSDTTTGLRTAMSNLLQLLQEVSMFMRQKEDITGTLQQCKCKDLLSLPYYFS
ncbi:interleukin-23 subunit alpha-like [Ahaetulla prasina]|uniref:interleukin-23 subunit alpha-like n=1 Tax=Ahaetulla prasina TaxID=499056 RepID=UPI0026489DF9|nr:interleukin-23 subunit alpha-like [Ahaetulla prasina]